MEHGTPDGDAPRVSTPYELADGIPTNGQDAGAAHRAHVREQNARQQRTEAHARRKAAQRQGPGATSTAATRHACPGYEVALEVARA